MSGLGVGSAVGSKVASRVGMEVHTKAILEQRLWCQSKTLVVYGSVIGHMMLALIAFASGLLVYSCCQTHSIRTSIM